MGFSLNSRNYNSVRNTPSVHYGRWNVAARYNNQAMTKAMYGYGAQMSTGPTFVMMQQPVEHRSKIAQVFNAITTGVNGFLGGFGIGSGNANMASAGMMGCMGNMGMFGGTGMFGGCSGNMMSMQGSLFGNRFMC